MRPKNWVHPTGLARKSLPDRYRACNLSRHIHASYNWQLLVALISLVVLKWKRGITDNSWDKTSLRSNWRTVITANSRSWCSFRMSAGFLISNLFWIFYSLIAMYQHCVNCVRIRSYYGPYFHIFALNTERYSVSLCIQPECGKIRTK